MEPMRRVHVLPCLTLGWDPEVTKMMDAQCSRHIALSPARAEACQLGKGR